MNFIKKYKLTKNISMILILIISVTMFLGYIVRLRSIITGSVFELTRSDFIRFFNIILSIIAVFSCLLSYSSNKKDELFIITQMYIVFLVDIIISNKYNYTSNNVNEYIAMGSSALKICILVLAVSNFKKIKHLIIKNKFKSIMLTTLVSIIIISAEYNYNIPNFMQDEFFFIIYNEVIFLIYILISGILFKKSIFEGEYIYGVIGSSILIFATKSIYTIANQIIINDEIRLTSVSLTYMGFIILILGLFIELSQIIKKNNELEEENSLFFNIIEETGHSSILICDNQYNIKYRNKRARDYEGKLKITNKTEKQIKVDINKIFGDEESYQRFNRDINENGYFNENVTIKDVNRIIDMSVQVLNKNKKIFKIITLKDITNQYEMEKSILEYKHMKEEENMKSEFFSNISHELKTPLNIIYSTIQLLNYSIDKDDFKDLYLKYKNTIDINCKRMIRLIDNIVDVTKFEVGFKLPTYNNYEIVNIIEEIVMSTINYAKFKDINIVFDTEIEELEIKSDPNMLERILLNLLSNAIKFTSRNGNILVYVEVDEKWLSIKVKDDGIGIPIEKQEAIFDRFVQGDKSIRRQNEGSGIGLSIVKYITELMNGKIYLKSDGQNGCEFTVLLPNEKMEQIKDEVEILAYDVNSQRIQLEFSDIYEVYEYSY